MHRLEDVARRTVLEPGDVSQDALLSEPLAAAAQGLGDPVGEEAEDDLAPPPRLHAILARLGRRAQGRTSRLEPRGLARPRPAETGLRAAPVPQPKPPRPR